MGLKRHVPNGLTLLRVVLADGWTARAVLLPDAPSFVVPSRPNTLLECCSHNLGTFYGRARAGGAEASA